MVSVSSVGKCMQLVRITRAHCALILPTIMALYCIVPIVSNCEFPHSYVYIFIAAIVLYPHVYTSYLAMSILAGAAQAAFN